MRFSPNRFRSKLALFLNKIRSFGAVCDIGAAAGLTLVSASIYSNVVFYSTTGNISLWIVDGDRDSWIV